MLELFQALGQLLQALVQLAAALGGLLIPWAPLIGWVAFWMLAVNWVKLRRHLLAGGWIAVLLLGLTAVFVWGTISSPEGGYYDIYGLMVSNYVGKTVYVTGLICIALLAGSVQLAGLTPYVEAADAAADPEPHGHDSHGHDSHGHAPHGHEAHGHAHATTAAAHH